MSLESIISQLQSVNPYAGGGKVTPEAIASGITKTRNSVIRLTKLLQNSGRVAGSRYTPNQSVTSNDAKQYGRTLERLSRDVKKNSSEHSKLKAYTEQSVNGLKRQINSLKSAVDRNKDVLKSIQSELALRRPQKELKKAIDATNSKLNSFNKTMRLELRTINQRIDAVEKRQLRIIQRIDDLETGAPRAKGAGGGAGDLVGRGVPLNFKQRLDYVERIAMQARANAMGATMSLGSSDLPEGSREGQQRGEEFARGLVMLFGPAAAAVAGSKVKDLLGIMGGSALDSMKEIAKKLGFGKAEPTAGAPVIGPDGKVRITSGAAGSKDVRDIMEKEKSFSEQLAQAKTPEAKAAIQKELDELKKKRLEALKDSGIITSEHVAAGMAKEEDVNFYKTETAEGIRYVDAAVVKEFPEIWQKSEQQPEIVVLRPDWEKTVESNPELKKKIEAKTRELKGAMETGKTGVRSVKNNNPGNLMYDKRFAVPGGVFENAIGEDAEGFAVFRTMEDGVDAMVQQINLDTQTRGKTLKELIEKYAPKGHKDNDPEKYIEFVSKKTGLKADEKVPKEKVKSLVEAMVEMEGGKSALETFAEAIGRQLNVDTTAATSKEQDGTVVAATTAPAGATPTPTVAPAGATPTPTVAPAGATPTPTVAPAPDKEVVAAVKTPELRSEEVEAEVQKTEMVAQNVERDDKIDQALGMTLGQQQQMMAMATTIDKSLTVLGQKTNRALSMMDTGVADYTVRNSRLDKYA